MFEQLKSIIQQEIQELNQALVLEKKKRDAILSVSGKDLKEVNTEEEKIQKRMLDLEKSRIRAIDHIRRKHLIGIESADQVKFSHIIDSMVEQGVADSGAFRSLLDEYRGIARSLQDEISANTQMLNQSQSYIQRTIHSLKESEGADSVYGPGGKRQNAPAGTPSSGSVFLNANA